MWFLLQRQIHLGSQKQNLFLCLKLSALNYAAIITDAVLLAEWEKLDTDSENGSIR